MTEDKLPTYSSDEDLRTIDEKFLPFREKLLKKIHKFERENNCKIVARRNLEFVYFINIRKPDPYNVLKLELINKIKAEWDKSKFGAWLAYNEPQWIKDITPDNSHVLNGILDKAIDKFLQDLITKQKPIL